MNLKLVKEKYPKAYQMAELWLLNKKAVINIDSTFFRHLYDFFDEQGIYIGTGYYADPPTYYFCSINNSFCGSGATRTEAEEQAFIKAFEILEDK